MSPPGGPVTIGGAFEHHFWLGRLGPGARFSKVPIINGPGKLSRFPLKIEVSIVLHLT